MTSLTYRGLIYLKLREIAPEYYNNLVYHKSWTKLWLKFIFDNELSLFSRILRSDKGGLEVSSDSENDYFRGRDQKENIAIN